jgi:crotonobetainyl-CoA hydratase
MTAEASDMQQPVHIEIQDGIASVVLNRPEAMNAINRDLSNAIAELMQQADTDPDIKAVVLSSAHPKVFCAGADLGALSQGIETYDTEGPNASWGLAGCTSRTPSVPVIAAVDGVALGGGFEIALAADILVASSAASFGLPEVQVGLIAAAGGVVRLPRQLPVKIAMDMMLTAERLNAERAYALGLISRLTEPGAAYDTAMEVATRIAGNAPLAVRASKATALDLTNGVAREEAPRWERSNEAFASIKASDDAREGATAFKEKRAPQWTGR